VPSNVDLVNRALLGVGARANISTMTENSTESNAANILFQPTFEQLGRTANWNCLRKQTNLTLLKAAAGTPENADGTVLPIPPQPWLYEYAYPTDCLRVRYILPTFTSLSSVAAPLFPVANSAATTYSSAGGQLPFAVNYDTDVNGNPYVSILTGVAGAQVVYTVNAANPNIWDSQFQAAFVASLGAFLVPALSLNMPLMQMMARAAERLIADARASDGNEGYQSQNREADWIVARGGNHSVNGMFGYGCGYDSMSWPVWSGA
jgi:hypothetical protein